MDVGVDVDVDMDVDAWQVIHKPNSVSVHKSFQAEIYVLNKDEGGRHTPFFSNYR